MTETTVTEHLYDLGGRVIKTTVTTTTEPGPEVATTKFVEWRLQKVLTELHELVSKASAKPEIEDFD